MGTQGKQSHFVSYISFGPLWPKQEVAAHAPRSSALLMAREQQWMAALKKTPEQ
jgi:hypothetical protein